MSDFLQVLDVVRDRVESIVLKVEVDKRGGGRKKIKWRASQSIVVQHEGLKIGTRKICGEFIKQVGSKSQISQGRKRAKRSKRAPSQLVKLQ